MSKAMGIRPSALYGLQGLEAYAFDSAIVRWGTAFEAALEEAGQDAKKPEDAKRAVERELRRWIPSTRKYAEVQR